MNGLINLVPWREERVRQRARRWGALFIVILGIMALSGGIWRWRIENHIVQATLYSSSQEQLNTLRAYGEHQQKRLDEITRRQQQQRAAQRHQQIFERWQHRLEQLALRLPPTLWLSALRYDSGQLEMTGKSLTAQALRQWAQALASLPGLSGLRQGATTRDAEAIWHFSWTLAIGDDDAQTP